MKVSSDWNLSSKTRQKHKILNPLLRQWPRGMVADSRWLAAHGVTRQLAKTYKQAGWLDALGHGAFLRAGDTARWSGGLHTVQRDSNCSIHPGGKTALSLLGYGHFLEWGEDAPLWVFGRPGERLPAWFVRGPWKDRLRFVAASLFEESAGLSATFVEREVDGLPLRLSSPERAMLEVLYSVPRQQSVEEAALLMEGLPTLRPKLVQSLLESCTSVKVKRLFLALAELSNHAWLSKLDLSRVDLGSGKRQIVSGGRLHPKYRITLPASLVKGSTESES